MHVVIIHGYFLKGTGSNLFVRNLSLELCKAGHNVTLICQENSVSEIDFIENAFQLSSDNKKLQPFHTKITPYKGKCTLVRPNINSFLPVYVYDQYTGYSVKEYHSCSQTEIEGYIEDNVTAINTALVNTAAVDMVLSNHTIMQPVYVARSKLGKSSCKHIAIVHGSCLNFSVKKSSLLQKYAWETIHSADKLAFVSKYSKDEFLSFFNFDREINEKSVVIPGGVDLDKFLPLGEGISKKKELDILLEELCLQSRKEDHQNQKKKESIWKTDADIQTKLQKLNIEAFQTIIYYGKYLWTKGVHLIISASPIILMHHPNTQFILVGYGSSRAYFEALIAALHKGNRKKYIQLLEHPELFDPEIDPDSSNLFIGLIEKLKNEEFAEEYFSIAKSRVKAAITFTGFLSHDHLKYLIACSDISVAPSIFSEAFGLVAVEALSAGIIPIQTNHSGFSDVIKKYVDEFSDIFDKRALVPLFLDSNIVLNIANNSCILLDYYAKIDEHQRYLIRQRARKIAGENYSWSAIAYRYVSLCHGNEE